MRNLVQPPPSVRCGHCDGEVRLKRIEPADRVRELDAQTFVCAKCGREQSYVVDHDRYAAHTDMRPGRMG